MRNMVREYVLSFFNALSLRMSLIGDHVRYSPNFVFVNTVEGLRGAIYATTTSQNSMFLVADKPQIYIVTGTAFSNPSPTKPWFTASRIHSLLGTSENTYGSGSHWLRLCPTPPSATMRR